MNIKLNRACRLTRHLPKAQEEILASMPDELVACLTSRELALVMDALDRHWHKARAFEAREIWDNEVAYSAAGYRELGPFVPYPPESACAAELAQEYEPIGADKAKELFEAGRRVLSERTK
jgi:hypothetical protein